MHYSRAGGSTVTCIARGVSFPPRLPHPARAGSAPTAASHGQQCQQHPPPPFPCDWLLHVPRPDLRGMGGRPASRTPWLPTSRRPRAYRLTLSWTRDWLPLRPTPRTPSAWISCNPRRSIKEQIIAIPFTRPAEVSRRAHSQRAGKRVFVVAAGLSPPVGVWGGGRVALKFLKDLN